MHYTEPGWPSGWCGARPAPAPWERDRIFVTPIKHAEYQGIRVTPNVYTTLEEIDTFASAMEEILEKGI